MGREERGATAVEYGMLIAFIAALLFASVQALGSHTSSALDAPCRELVAVGRPC
jgi:Flp pilus assembly pilin Flp